MIKQLLRYLKLRFFTKYYFVSGTFEHKGERKWFRVLYAPKSGYVNEKELLEIWKENLNYDFEYFVVTNFKRISSKQYLNF